MWKRNLYFLACLVAVLIVSGCARFDNPRVSLNEEFSLSIGQRASIVDEDLEISFKEVIEDSRCPGGATCIWAGRVSCLIELVHKGSSYRMVLTEPGLKDEYSKERYQRYELMFHITPYPEAGKEISKDEYRLHLIVTELPEVITGIIGSVLASPSTFNGQEITVIGYYRGWDLLHEANVSPPDTRSDWVIKDSTGAIYVSANSPVKLPEMLKPDSMQYTGIILQVTGVIRVTSAGQPYIEAKTIQLIP